jgi:hypothetical protein
MATPYSENEDQLPLRWEEGTNMVRRRLLHFILKVEAVWLSETLVSYHIATWYHYAGYESSLVLRIYDSRSGFGISVGRRFSAIPGRDFSLRRNVRTGSGTPAASYVMNTTRVIPRSDSGRGVKLTCIYCLVSECVELYRLSLICLHIVMLKQ